MVSSSAVVVDKAREMLDSMRVSACGNTAEQSVRTRELSIWPAELSTCTTELSVRRAKMSTRTTEQYVKSVSVSLF